MCDTYLPGELAETERVTPIRDDVSIHYRECSAQHSRSRSDTQPRLTGMGNQGLVDGVEDHHSGNLNITVSKRSETSEGLRRTTDLIGHLSFWWV